MQEGRLAKGTRCRVEAAWATADGRALPSSFAVVLLAVVLLRPRMPAPLWLPYTLDPTMADLGMPPAGRQVVEEPPLCVDLDGMLLRAETSWVLAAMVAAIVLAAA